MQMAENMFFHPQDGRETVEVIAEERDNLLEQVSNLQEQV